MSKNAKNVRSFTHEKSKMHKKSGLLHCFLGVLVVLVVLVLCVCAWREWW